VATPGPFASATLCSFLPQEAATVRGPENSEVFPPPRSSAVAVTVCPTGTASRALELSPSALVRLQNRVTFYMYMRNAYSGMDI
jgi:hypothetical protein